MDCSCPLCPLVAFKVNTRDVYVLVLKEKKNLRAYPAVPRELMSGRTNEEVNVICKCFADIAVAAFDDMKKEKTITWSNHNTACCVFAQMIGKEVHISFTTHE